METKLLTESEKQREIDKFVSREVIHCASMLVSQLSEEKEGGLYEEFPELFSGNASIGTWTCTDCDHTWEEGPENVKECPACGMFVSDEDFEPEEYHEILEHWVVSEYLARELERRGESITRDFYGFTIWGRPTHGQAISLDGVIIEIWEELFNA